MNCHTLRTHAVRSGMVVALAALLLGLHAEARAQRGGQARPPVSAQAGAAIDLTGYWVSVISQDWQFRMVTPAKGEYAAVPINTEGRRVADAWDPARDEAAGEACRAYGAAAIMRLPENLHITWDDDNTLRIDVDSGEQTRLFRFGDAPPSGEDEPTWQGSSRARWEYATGQGATTPVGERTGTLKVVTTGMRPGYLRKNGVPYSADAVVNENYQRIEAPNGDSWLVVTTIVDDPQYLSRPFVTSANFRKLPDGSSWNPTPCSAR